MLDMILDIQDRIAVIEYLHSKGGCLIEMNGDICSDPECPSREHFIIFEQSLIQAYDGNPPTKQNMLSTDDVRYSNCRLNPLCRAHVYEDSDVIVFGAGWRIKNKNSYMYSGIAFRPRRLDGTEKSSWLRAEYNSLVRFIKKRTVKYKSIYLSHSIAVDREQNRITIYGM